MLLLLFAALVCAFDLSADNNVAIYWGLNGGDDLQPLASYCNDTTKQTADIIILSFINSISPVSMSIDMECTETLVGGNARYCPQLGADIKACQANGKIVLASIGGQYGNYNLTSDSEGETVAETLWDMFGEGEGSQRPFGDAVIDGFDLDLEQKDETGYVAFANKLNALYKEGSKKFYLSAAPQCPYPDESVGKVLANAHVDFAFIQFYNNDCASKNGFNWETWANFAAKSSPNKDIRLFMGVPATKSIDGYAPLNEIKDRVSQIRGNNFGGVSIWDASYTGENSQGSTFISKVKDVLNKSSHSSSAPKLLLSHRVFLSMSVLIILQML